MTDPLHHPKSAAEAAAAFMREVPEDPHQTTNPPQQRHNLEKTVNIDNLTFGELKQIAALFGAQQTAKPANIADPLIGKYCIARCYSAGVHAGIVEAVDGESVTLRNSRRLWAWKAADGVALSGVAQHGLKAGSKLDVINPTHYLTGVCELIPVGPGIAEAINAYK